MLDKLDTIIEQTKAKGETAIQLPDTDVEIIVKNCSSDKQQCLSELLKKLIDENINKHVELKDDLSNESLHQLKEAVDKAVMTFLSNGQQITETKMKCILLRIRCFSLKDLVRLFRDCVSGKLNQQFKSLEAAVKEIPEFKEVALEAVIFEDEFWKVMEKTLTRRKSTVTLEQTESNNGSFRHTVKVSIPTESAGHLEQLKRSFKSGRIKSITNSIQEAACKELNVTDVSIEARLLEKKPKLDARDHEETKSREDYKRESQEMKQRVVEMEAENTSLKLGAEGVLDQIVEGASETDQTFREKAKEIAKQEVIFQETKEEVHSDTSYNTGDERKDEQDLVRQLQYSATDSSKPVPDKPHHHVWSVASTQTYKIRVAGEITCNIFSCCQLPSGEILLADHKNSRLKKLDAGYQVIGVCDLPGRPFDVCYIGNNEAVVSVLHRKLQFVDVAGMTLTRSVRTGHECVGLACHGNQLFVTDAGTAFVYSTDGIKQRVLYNLHGTHCNESIAVSDDVSKIYITNWDKFVTIDSSGNHLYTYTDPELRLFRAVCVDGEGHALGCELSSNSILQFSSDGKHKLGTVAISSQMMDNRIVRAICFDRHKSILTCAGQSDNVAVLQLI